MYLLVVYDIEETRVAKVCKFLRRYLNWIQNSVFEGNLTESELKKVKKELKKIIDEKYDSVLIFKMRDKRYVDKEVLGIEKTELSNIF
ncbi:MAG: CRISPR-associated endonuclease Cas2 [Euryarchaeota archaeon]|nr:CRISPR-associated endonuclease Cas2 [Euryarchaeota archaeon]